MLANESLILLEHRSGARLGIEVVDHPLATSGPHLLAEFRVGCELQEGGGQCRRVASRYDEAIDTVGHQLTHTPDVSDDHGETDGHRFECRIAQTLAHTRVQKDVRASKCPANVNGAEMVSHAYAVLQIEVTDGGQDAGTSRGTSITDDRVLHFEAGTSNLVERHQRVLVPLHPMKPSDAHDPEHLTGDSCGRGSRVWRRSRTEELGVHAPRSDEDFRRVDSERDGLSGELLGDTVHRIDAVEDKADVLAGIGRRRGGRYADRSHGS